MLYLLLIILLLPLVDAIRIGTINIRVPADPAPYDWNSRKYRITDMIKKYDMDIIGIQEAGYSTIDDLLNLLSGYCKVNQVIFDNAIIYKCNLNLTDSKMYAISNTPNAIGSNSWGLIYPRTVLYAQIDKYAVYNTHLDILPKTIQQSFIVDRICESHADRKIIVTGDFNSDNINSFLSIGLRDTSGIIPTFNGFGGYSGAKIDYILVSNDIYAHGQILYDKIDNLFVTDHAIIIVDL